MNSKGYKEPLSEISMAQQDAQVLGNELVEVGFAREFQEAVISSKVLEFADVSFKNKILGAEKDQLLVVTSTINSPKMVKSVEFYDQDLLLNTL